MADSTSPKGSSGDFAKKVQRQLSRGKEMVLQKLGKTEESRDDQFERCVRQFNDQQTDGNRIHKDLRNYINAVRDMREASRRLSQSLFDSYEADWVGEEDLACIVEGEDLLWNDYEVKLLDQALRTAESYVCQFPDVRDKIAKRGRKLVDYDSSRHHLEALQTAKKRDDIKIKKAEEEMRDAKMIYEGINNDLKEELPVLYESRIGCYISVFSAVSNLRSVFYKEMGTLNVDLQNVLKELQAQHPDKVFAVRGMQRYGSLRRRTLMSPRAWKASFSEFHRSYSPKSGPRHSFRSPEKPPHSPLSRENSSLAASSHSSIVENPASETRDLDSVSSGTEIHSPSAGGGAAAEDGNRAEEEEGVKEGDSAPPAKSDNEGHDEKESESSSELNDSHDSASLELQLSTADDGPLRIEEEDEVDLSNPKHNGLENGEVSGIKDLSIPHKEASVEKQAPLDTKSTTV